MLATPIRLKIISAVCNGERNVSELLAQIPTTQPNMSQHLRCLGWTGANGTPGWRDSSPLQPYLRPVPLSP